MTPERKQKIERVLAYKQNDITVVLENVEDPHNIAAVMRSCDAIGLSEIYVIKTRIPKRKKWGKNSSSGAYKWLIVHEFDEVKACMEMVKRKYTKVLTTHLSVDAHDLYTQDLTQSVALVFGNEGLGISDELLSYSQGNFIIPQVGMIQSLNISVACAITLFEARRQKELAGHYAQKKISALEEQSLLAYWNIHLHE